MNIEIVKVIERIFKFFKGFLSEFSGKEFLVFLFFLALSGIFWLMMTLNETYEVEFPVCVRLMGVPKNVVMTSEMSDTIRVSVRDKGYVIGAYETYKRLQPIRLNFATYANKQTGHGKVTSADLLKAMRQQLYSSSAITALKAEKLEFYFNYGRNRKIKISLKGTINPGGNYYLAHAQLIPDFATVYANKELLKSITTVETENLNISNFEDTVTCTVNLKSITGAKIVPMKVKVVLYPDVLTEGSLEVPIKAINKPANLTIRTFPQTATVKYNVGSNVYRFVRPSDFEVIVNYNEIAEHPSDKCNLYLRSHSRFARNARLETSQVDYLIEQQ